MFYHVSSKITDVCWGICNQDNGSRILNPLVYLKTFRFVNVHRKKNCGTAWVLIQDPYIHTYVYITYVYIYVYHIYTKSISHSISESVSFYIHNALRSTLVVSWNRGTPKSSILVGFSLTNQPFGIPASMETPISKPMKPAVENPPPAPLGKPFCKELMVPVRQPTAHVGADAQDGTALGIGAWTGSLSSREK